MPLSPTRLAWRLRVEASGVELQPCAQTRGPDGYGRGRRLPLARLLAEQDNLDWLSGQDRLILRALAALQADIAADDHAALDALAALPLLVGHPALYWADAPEQPLRMEAGQVALELERQGEQITLRLSPPGIAACAGVLWRKLTPDRLAVYRLDEEVRQIAALLGHSLSLPWHARKKVLDAIRDIAPDLPLHDVSASFDDSLPSQPADAVLRALLRLDDAGLRLQLKVRPHPASALYAPGRGAPGLVVSVDGVAQQLKRDLPAERARQRRVHAACPTLAAARRDGDEWVVDGQQTALDLLAELQTLDADTLQCEWPSGQRQRIRAGVGLPQLKLSAKRKGGWLEVDGELGLDDGNILALRHLLEALAGQSGRYLRLSDGDWLALSDSLAARLRQLTLLADHAGPGGLRLSPLAAPRLGELAAEAGAFDGDAGWNEQWRRLQSLQNFEPEVPAGLRATLRPYQLQGYNWLARLAHWGAGACLADDMGLGKTVQTLALLLSRAALGPQLVVAPTSVALNWLAEAARFAPGLRLLPYQQHRRLDAAGPGDLVVASYGLLQRDADAFADVRWASVVLDEAQAIKNAASQRAQAAHALYADFRLAASGTPVENHLGELWSLFRFVAPGLLGNEDKFQQRFAQPIADGDEDAREALKALIRPYLLRRTKQQVLTELPPRTDITRAIPLSEAEMEVYEAMRQQALDKLAQPGEAEGGAMQVLAELTRLRRFCCHPTLTQPDSALPATKQTLFRELMLELLDNGHKALVFSQFVDHLAIVRRWLDEQGIRYQYLDGAVPGAQRKARMDAFQAGDGDVFLISLKAGGTGLNLTAADYVIHLDPWWNPAVEDQASDRAYRMGQQRPVTVYRLVAQHTIEEKIVALHASKRELADSLLDGGDLSARLDGAALLALLRQS